MITEDEKLLIQSIENDLKFKRLISIIRISIAIGLVLSILLFCYLNYSYAKNINELRKEYGPIWSCYLCGYENLRTCSCMYSYENIEITENMKEDIGSSNILKCMN